MCTLDKIYPNSAGNGPVVHGVRDVAPVVWQPPLDVVIYASAWAEDPVLAPSERVVVGVGFWLFEGHGGDITVEGWIGWDWMGLERLELEMYIICFWKKKSANWQYVML